MLKINTTGKKFFLASFSILFLSTQPADSNEIKPAAGSRPQTAEAKVMKVEEKLDNIAQEMEKGMQIVEKAVTILETASGEATTLAHAVVIKVAMALRNMKSDMSKITSTAQHAEAQLKELQGQFKKSK